jgi:hypothetical protein
MSSFWSCPVMVDVCIYYFFLFMFWYPWQRTGILLVQKKESIPPTWWQPVYKQDIWMGVNMNTVVVHNINPTGIQSQRAIVKPSARAIGLRKNSLHILILMQWCRLILDQKTTLHIANTTLWSSHNRLATKTDDDAKRDCTNWSASAKRKQESEF